MKIRLKYVVLLTFQGICVAIIVFLLVLFVEVFSIVQSNAHYIGTVVVTNNTQKEDISTLIVNNYNTGPLGVWSRPFTVEEADNGYEIIRYAFFSTNENLPLTKVNND